MIPRVTISVERLFLEPSLPLPQVLWVMLPYNLAGNLHTERILHVPAAPALTSSHSLEGTKSYHPQPGRIHPGSTASDPGKGSEEKAAEGVCFRLDPVTGRVISPAGVAPDLHCRLCPHTALLAADVAQRVVHTGGPHGGCLGVRSRRILCLRESELEAMVQQRTRCCQQSRSQLESVVSREFVSLALSPFP